MNAPIVYDSDIEKARKIISLVDSYYVFNAKLDKNVEYIICKWPYIQITLPTKPGDEYATVADPQIPNYSIKVLIHELPSSYLRQVAKEAHE